MWLKIAAKQWAFSAVPDWFEHITDWTVQARNMLVDSCWNWEQLLIFLSSWHVGVSLLSMTLYKISGPRIRQLYRAILGWGSCNGSPPVVEIREANKFLWSLTLPVRSNSASSDLTSFIFLISIFANYCINCTIITVTYYFAIPLVTWICLRSLGFSQLFSRDHCLLTCQQHVLSDLSHQRVLTSNGTEGGVVPFTASSTNSFSFLCFHRRWYSRIFCSKETESWLGPHSFPNRKEWEACCGCHWRHCLGRRPGGDTWLSLSYRTRAGNTVN